MVVIKQGLKRIQYQVVQKVKRVTEKFKKKTFYFLTILFIPIFVLQNVLINIKREIKII